MGMSWSKLRPLEYTCYEVVHPWNVDCIESSLELLYQSFYASLKTYSFVYLVAAILARNPSVSGLVISLRNILQSSLFLSYTAFGYHIGACQIRRLLGFYNYYTVGWLNSFVTSFLTIFLERPTRRPLLAIYVAYVATESLITFYSNHGLLPRIPYWETILFSFVSGSLHSLYRSHIEKKKLEGKQEDKKSHTDFAFVLLRQVLAGEENFAQCNNNHKLQDCLLNAVKGFLRNFSGGVVIQVLLVLVGLLQKKSRNLSVLFQKKNLQIGLFLGSYAGLFNIAKYIFNQLFQSNGSKVTFLSGFTAGMSMVFYRSPSIAIYTLWKSLEISCRKLVEDGMLPRVPLAAEFLYAAGTALLFHLSIVEPHSLKPSYYTFLNRITGNRMKEVNRALLDHEYGTNSTKIYRHYPTYDVSKISDKLKYLLPHL